MRLFVILLLAAGVCFPQATRRRVPAKSTKPAKTPAPGVQWPLMKLDVTGNKLYTAQQIIEASGLKLGAPTTKDALEAARERLSATGAFESVGYQFGPTADGKGYHGTLEVVEVQNLYPFRFEDLPEPDKQLRAYLSEREPLFRNRLPATRELLDRYEQEVQRALSKTDFKDKVVAKLVSDKPGELTILFRPSRPAPSIAQIHFTGNQALPAEKLQSTLGEVAIGISYSDVAVRQRLETSIRPLYEARGRLDVKFLEISTEPMKEVKGLRVDVKVDEGPVYNFGEIRSNIHELQPKRVLKTAKVKTGDVANFDAVNAAIDQLQKEMRTDGYMRAKVKVERQMHEKEKTVDITFTSDAGPRFVMGKLTIQGLDLEGEPAVRKLWSMKTGEPYDAGYPTMFVDRIKQDGYFDNLRTTSFEQSVNDETGTVDVTLNFKGGPDPEAAKKKRDPYE